MRRPRASKAPARQPPLGVNPGWSRSQTSYPASSNSPTGSSMQRRTSTLALAALAAAPLMWPSGALSQAEPLRIGFLTVRSGPLAAGGRQMEEGFQLLLKERNNMLAGRRVELVIA